MGSFPDPPFTTTTHQPTRRRACRFTTERGRGTATASTDAGQPRWRREAGLAAARRWTTRPSGRMRSTVFRGTTSAPGRTSGTTLVPPVPAGTRCHASIRSTTRTCRPELLKAIERLTRSPSTMWPLSTAGRIAGDDACHQ